MWMHTGLNCCLCLLFEQSHDASALRPYNSYEHYDKIANLQYTNDTLIHIIKKYLKVFAKFTKFGSGVEKKHKSAHHPSIIEFI